MSAPAARGETRDELRAGASLAEVFAKYGVL